MSGSPFSGLSIVQLGVVVADLEGSAARQSTLLGNGPWRLYEFGPHMMENYLVRGEPGTGRTLVALNDAHPQLELLQPMGGTSIHQEWLDEHGEGVHHVGAVVDDVEAVVTAAAAEDIGVLSRGEAFGPDGSGRFAYFDTHDLLGMIFEVFEPPTSLGEPLKLL